MNLKYPLILASKSPRRQEMLRQAGIPFSIQTKDTAENFPADMSVNYVARYLAEIKAEAFRPEAANHIILTADTTVVVDDMILNKPAGAEEAAEMLRLLSGRSHRVISGACILCGEQRISFDDTTEVFFRQLTNAEISHYIQQYQPFDKAGSYGIQEWIGLIGIEKIIGSYYTVVGLPIQRVYQELQKFR